MILSSEKKEIQTKEPIPVFLAANRNYLPHAAVVCLSILDHTKSPIIFEILIARDVTGKDIRRFRKNFKQFNTVFNFHRIYDKYDFSKFDTPSQWTETANYRLAIPVLFPQCKKAVYLDCDVIITGDITEYFNIDLGKNIIAGVKEPHWQSLYELNIQLSDNESFQEHYKDKIKDYHTFINSGVLLLNIQQICREPDMLKKFTDILEHPYGFSTGPDQDFLNIACQDRIMHLPDRYNKMLDSCFFDEPKENYLILHCVYKPWKTDRITFPYSACLYWYYLGKTNYYYEIRGEFLFNLLRTTFDVYDNKNFLISRISILFGVCWNLFINYLFLFKKKIKGKYH